ncbi:MAG: mannose-1-phosphate guanylyltransferase/mannose-6-phosphate isomerase [Sphingobium sp.]|uniref:mannose-1-phosphate guanylyltransferase/mannose-6-phosphate isomerase n=1 Tax=Sphingobium sp. TaxID=1912891 RepID=UPI0029A89E07|nr:mannose-1-phosphate guanylyltransferase/mannose-6-phosphate isomerase [Sphingobium sp.]MDX3908838.1 mannose-1-phosphate guanylyltransferase/mannose-6-phosphate isomerase [Sphingobium sp.]
MTASVVPVILSGGSGTRLWPVSRPERPKQLLALTAAETMLQLTARRTDSTTTASYLSFGTPILVANANHADLIEEQLAEIGITESHILLEPFGRNTAPAIALAALVAKDPADALLVMPSDHVIADLPAFHAAIAQALPLVAEGWLVTFGITPDAPETGYGYIQMGDAVQGTVNSVTRFVEKPDAVRAAEMLAEGGYAWNAGIFLFRADAYLAALETFQPSMLLHAKASLDKGRKDGQRLYPDADAFEACPSDSIDYAVMERAEKVACVPVDMGWSDVGSWDSLHTISDKDESGNAVRGDVLTIDAARCLVHSDGPRVAMVGVEDLIVVVAQGDIMILRRGQSQNVKKVTEALKNR